MAATEGLRHDVARDVRDAVVRPLSRAAERPCARPGCPSPATATLTFQYGSRQAWVRRLAETATPDAYDLCGNHASRTRVPRGWELTDTRPADERQESPARTPVDLGGDATVAVLAAALRAVPDAAPATSTAASAAARLAGRRATARRTQRPPRDTVAVDGSAAGPKVPAALPSDTSARPEDTPSPVLGSALESDAPAAPRSDSPAAPRSDSPADLRVGSSTGPASGPDPGTASGPSASATRPTRRRARSAPPGPATTW